MSPLGLLFDSRLQSREVVPYHIIGNPSGYRILISSKFMAGLEINRDY
jgi:hypothetical protein